MTHRNFCEILVRELIIHLQEKNVTAIGTSRGRPSPTVSQLSQLEVNHSQHWPSKAKQWRSPVFAAQANTQHAIFLQEV
jgi:hypothetical protein